MPAKSMRGEMLSRVFVKEWHFMEEIPVCQTQWPLFFELKN
jgi:hypothetical protein